MQQTNIRTVNSTFNRNNNRQPRPPQQSNQQRPHDVNQQQNGQPNQAQQDAKQKQQQAQKAKKKRGPITLKPEHFEQDRGLKRLYQFTNQINWSDPMPTQSAMNLVVMTLKTWHNQLMPKHSCQYFLSRCQALGNNKLVSAYMHKVRRIHKGVQKWSEQETKPENLNPNQQANMNNGNGNKKRQNNEESDDGVDLDYPQFNDNDENAENGIDLQEQINQFQKFRQRAQLAKKLGGFNNNERVMGTDKKEIDKGKQTDQYMRQIQKGMDQLMDDDDLLMLQEMKRRKEQKLKANQASSNTGGNVSGDKNKRVQLYIDQDQNGVDLDMNNDVILSDDGYDD